MKNKMKSCLVALVLSLAMSMPAAAGPFQEGAKAYKGGDYKTAKDLWHPLAIKGDPNGQYGLGLLYEMGKGVKRNYVLAYKWYSLSAAAGHKSGVKSRDKVATSLTRAQVTKARGMVKAWKPKE